ncbi:MAG: hypothetical protein A2W90_07375 [Bacteroidetes bacterium GWF2_42_66]|nr:MAG: hypothetical protein A2W92_07365 [Bacteroidetes bacterium GWA2_42_15]OFX96911.1 MAG: hypothetical protein A2W89_20075 [Bacteroidetes bacterium GWE2_42_39]OFY44668.1 MAG: hypothetical protein A2W90_07375 [Bacteroidetes bacterium GWF2_42_66]HAZ02753.1 hypothetical protein [Marinilabiliales bacterium]HBL75046.1 hypothetical protein [Prolixibacteraceae bacterium]
MATVTNNIITLGLSGKVGNLVFRRRGNKTTVYIQSPRKAPLSEKQKQAQQRFAEAVALTKQALNDESERRKFEEMAKKEGKESAYSAAIAYFCKQIH